MAKPVILAVDDDPQVLRALERDLKQRYGSDYRVLRADSGTAALSLVEQLLTRHEVIALFVADQRMPGMSGVEFLAQTRESCPDARRVLLTAYADTDAAIDAINSVRLDYYLLKPWDPPEDKLYPVLDDLLDDWQAGYRPGFDGLRVIGDRWSADSHRVKEFLARNQVPYEWMDVEQAKEACSLYLSEDKPHLPLVVLSDGEKLQNPATSELAERIGLRLRAEKPFYDLMIVGGGPAGLAAAVYGASEGLRTVMIEREAPGGQAGTSSYIENYLGFPSGLSGAVLARRAVDQAKRFGVEIVAPQEVVALCPENQYRLAKLADGSEISCHALIIATGVSYRKLNVPGMEQLTGRGVYYGAALTEALSCKDSDVYIVGGANSAGQAALHFAKYASHVTMLVRGEGLQKSMSQYLIDSIEKVPNITVRSRTEVKEVHGQDSLEAITLKTPDGEEKVPGSALFIFIGAQPRTDWLDGIVQRDEHGFIYTGPELVANGKRPSDWKLDRDPYLLETSVPGIFAAGDVRHGSMKRIAGGVGEGSVCVSFVHQYLAKVR